MPPIGTTPPPPDPPPDGVWTRLHRWLYAAALDAWLSLRALGRVLWLCRFSLGPLLIGAYALLLNDQAQEVLREFAARDGWWGDVLEFLVFARVFLLWALNTWLCARLLTLLFSLWNDNHAGRTLEQDATGQAAAKAVVASGQDCEIPPSPDAQPQPPGAQYRCAVTSAAGFARERRTSHPRALVSRIASISLQRPVGGYARATGPRVCSRSTRTTIRPLQGIRSRSARSRAGVWAPWCSMAC
jgi:hypothetical protein